MMLERFNYDNFKNLAHNTATFVSDSAQVCMLGLAFASVKSIMHPSQSNLPSWASDAMANTNNIAITYLGSHLDATYVIAPAVGCVINPLINTIFKQAPADKSDKNENSLSQLAEVIALISKPILGLVVCQRLGYNMHCFEFINKAYFIPTLTCLAAQNLLNAAFPTPQDSEVSAIK